MKRLLHFGFLLSTFLVMDLFAGDNIKINANVWQRFEMDGRDFNDDISTDNNNYLRTRLGINMIAKL